MLEGTFRIVEERGGGLLHVSSSIDGCSSTWIETKSKRCGKAVVLSGNNDNLNEPRRIRITYDGTTYFTRIRLNRWTGRIYASSWPPTQDKDDGNHQEIKLLGYSNASIVSRFTERFLLTSRPFLWLGIGLIWILLFPAVTVTTGEFKTRGTYQSEKATLVGIPEVSFNGNDARVAVQTDERVAEMFYSSKSHLCESVRDMMMEKQLEANIYWKNQDECDVYGILRVPRTSGQEAILIHGTMELSDVKQQQKTKNRPGDISIILSLADVFSRSNWLSKDIIFLFTSENSSVESWLDDYNHGNNDLTNRSGLVRFALSLDIPRYESRHTLSILTHGTNGRTPNMDLVHLTIKYTSKYFCSSCPDSIETTAGMNYFNVVDKKSYLFRLSNMLKFGINMIRGSSGSHGHFLHYDIDALTISTRSSSDLDRNVKNIKITDIGRLVERVVRLLVLSFSHPPTHLLTQVHSMSNAEERLHHSYWLYLMPSHLHFVSIDEYVYSYFFLLFGAAYQLIQSRRHRMISRRNSNIDIYISLCVMPVLFIFGVGGISFLLIEYFDNYCLLVSVPCLAICLVMKLFLDVDVEACYDLITKIWIVTHVPLSVLNFSFGVVAALLGNLLFFISGPRDKFVTLRRMLLLLLSPGFLFYFYPVVQHDLLKEWTHRRNAALPYLFMLYSPMIAFFCVFGVVVHRSTSSSRSHHTAIKQKVK